MALHTLKPIKTADNGLIGGFYNKIKFIILLLLKTDLIIERKNGREKNEPFTTNSYLLRGIKSVCRVVKKADLFKKNRPLSKKRATLLFDFRKIQLPILFSC